MFCTSRCGCRALCTMGCFFESIPEVVVILDLIVCKKQSGLWSIILQHEVSPECIRTPQVLDKDNAWNFMSSMWLAVIRHSGLHKESSLYLLQNGSRCWYAPVSELICEILWLLGRKRSLGPGIFMNLKHGAHGVLNFIKNIYKL